MFDLVRNNKKIIQIVLALIMLPFALWGVDSYVRNGGGNDIASVADSPIAQEEFQRTLQEQQERLKAQLGGNVNPAILESPEFRRGVLQELINRRLLLVHAGKSHLGVSDQMLAGFITSLPALQVDGKFSKERYEAMAASQGMALEQFESLLKRDLLMQQATMAVGNAAIAGRLPADRWLMTQLEERDVAEVVLRAEQFADNSKPDAEAIKRYYDENRTRFERPEQIRVEYLTLSQEKLVDNVRVSDADIKAFYQANEQRYRKPEQRRASHILIRAEKKSPEADKAAEDKARQILDQLKTTPGDFAKLARQHSQDPGSASNGGDLGFFGRGMMVKPFEETTFALRENEISGIVRSDFGFHIIKLTGVRAEQAQSIDEVRQEITRELKRQAGAKQYAEAAEGFANIVYEQSDSLKPAAEKYGLNVQTSEWLARGGQLMAPFTQPKLSQAIFSADAINNHRNTEAVETAPNTLVSARVVEHRPATTEPLEAVAAMIEKVLSRETSLARAVAAGQANLEKLKKGENLSLGWGTVRTASRLHAPSLSPEGRDAVFGTPAQSLPAYAGAKTGAGYTLYRIEKRRAFDPAAEGEAAARAQSLRQQYSQIIAQEDMINWLAVLQQQYGVKINASALERK